MTETITITSTDVDDLAKLVYHEANNIKLYYEGAGMTEADAMMLAYGSVIDSVINRVALASNTWGSDVQSVMNFHGGSTYQYTALHDNSVTTAHDLPSFTGYATVRDFVDNYLTLRTSNAYIGDTGFNQNIIGANTHYYNPAITSPVWGDDMDFTETIGGGSTSHLTGIPRNGDGSPGEVPQAYYLSYDGNTSDLINPFGDPPLPGHKPLPPGYEPGDYDPAHTLAPGITGDIQPALADAVAATSPLVIDLSSGHSGISLTSWGASSTDTFFDLANNGFAVQTAWVSGDTGLLARDLDENGKIDSSAELFGSPTVDGFAKLAELDSNHDLRIDRNDTDWGTLVVWQDDGDAITQNGELHSLASLNIESIDLAAIASSTSNISGNPISHTSTVRFTGGANAAIVDAWFIHDNTNSYYTGNYTLEADALFLPTLRGYGTLPDLTIAMSQDSDLKELVSDFVGNFSLTSFTDAATLTSAVTDILYKWAGVEGVDPESRGQAIDAQHLEFLEHFLGTQFLQLGVNPDPASTAGALLEGAYQRAFNMLYADLLVQSGAGALFDGAVHYNPATGLVEGTLDLSHDTIDDLTLLAPSPGTANEQFWIAIGRLIEGAKGLDNVTVTEAGWLEDAINSTDSSLHWVSAVGYLATEIDGGGTDETLYGDSGNNIIHGNGGNDIVYGSTGNDTLYGDAGSDTLWGEDGDDTLLGGDGNDTLYGGGGANILNGGAGGNFLTGGTGNDTYVYDGGNDVISDPSGTDIITLPSGITLGDLSFERVSTATSTSEFDNLLINIAGSGSIEIVAQLYSSVVETIVFADTSTLSLSTITHPDAYLTTGNDSFYYTANSDMAVYGFAGNDSMTLSGSGSHTIDGGLGNDTITGGSGNDTYIASPGLDHISEYTGGTDTIVIPAEFDASDVTIFRVNNGSGPTSDLGISIANYGEIYVESQFSYSGYGVEYLHFLSDNSTVDLKAMTITTLGTSGNDTLSAPYYNAGANDIMDGREGDDGLYGGAGDDTYIFSAGHDVINETSGDDTIKVRESYDPGDVSIAFVEYNYADTSLKLTDSDGNSILVSGHSSSSSYAVEHIAFGDSTIWDLSSMEIETHGTNGDNYYLSGHDTGDASSDDTIYGYGGNDYLTGGNGDDHLYGGDGNDTLYGNNGASMSTELDVLHGDGGNDTIYADGSDVAYGDDGDDVIWAYNGWTGHPVTMYGGDGADTLHGGSGANVMNGGAGADTIYGSSGAVDDIVFDAATAFSAVDTIGGFSVGDGDKLDISDILDGHYTPGVDVITDFVQIQTSGSHSEVYVDTTGTGTFGSVQHIAEIQYVTGLTDEAALVTAGTLIAA